METFAERGYQSASLAEIAARVGLTQAGVLHYFSSKASLLTGVLDLRDSTDIEELGSEHPVAWRSCAISSRRPGATPSARGSCGSTPCSRRRA